MAWQNQKQPFVSPKTFSGSWTPRAEIPRTHSFSLGDFRDFERCVFRFFVNHHLEKKYQLAEGTPNQALGSILDLSLKKLHQTKMYDQPIENLLFLIKAAEIEMREDILRNGPISFYGSQIAFLTPELLDKAREIFKKYHQSIKGKYKRLVETPTTKKPRPFWKYQIAGQVMMQLWGGPDAIEIGEDGIPEVVDYKYFEDSKTSQEYLDMDLMPKVYVLLVAPELLALGFNKARFVIRFWQESNNNSYYEEFDLDKISNLADFFKDKIERILRTEELSFCERDYCKACQAAERESWINELALKGYIKSFSQAGENLPF